MTKLSIKSLLEKYSNKLSLLDSYQSPYVYFYTNQTDSEPSIILYLHEGEVILTKYKNIPLTKDWIAFAKAFKRAEEFTSIIMSDNTWK